MDGEQVTAALHSALVSRVDDIEAKARSSVNTLDERVTAIEKSAAEAPTVSAEEHHTFKQAVEEKFKAFEELLHHHGIRAQPEPEAADQEKAAAEA